MKKATLLLVAFILLIDCAQGGNEDRRAHSQGNVAADLILRNGAIYTVNAAQPWAEAVAVANGKIIFVGSNAGADSLKSNQTTVINLNGKMVLPGLHDVHTHPLEAGSPAGGDCSLDNEETDPENFIRALRVCNLKPNSNGWIVASGHSIFTLYEAQRPPKEILDEVFPNAPAAILEETSHSLWVNSKALAMAGIDANTSDPVGGHIIKWNAGEPSGILLDNAGDFVLQMALASTPTIDEQNYEGLVSYSLPLLAKMGVTSICEGRTYWKRNYHRIWQKIKSGGLLTARVVLAPWIYPEDADADLIAALKNLYDNGDDLLRINQLKCYSDGIIINATAALHEPYVDNLGFPFNRGLNYIAANRLTNLVAALEKIGYDFHIHTIGDRSVTEALDAIELARNANGNIGARHRLTHLEIVDPLDFGRFASLNITADVQVAGDFAKPENWKENEPLLGKARSNNFIPLKALYNAGARITLSSDWDVSTANPFVGMQHALTRSPQELPSVAAVIQAYTINAAYVMRQEDKVGSIETGKYADLIVIDQKLFEIPKGQIGQTKVLLTLLDGKEVYRDPILTGLNERETLEHDYRLAQNYPNPFRNGATSSTRSGGNSSTTIPFSLPQREHVTLKVFDVNGREVATLVESEMAAGKHAVTFTPREITTGLYFFKLTAGEYSQTRKAVLLP